MMLAQCYAMLRRMLLRAAENWQSAECARTRRTRKRARVRCGAAYAYVVTMREKAKIYAMRAVAYANELLASCRDN